MIIDRLLAIILLNTKYKKVVKQGSVIIHTIKHLNISYGMAQNKNFWKSISPSFRHNKLVSPFDISCSNNAKYDLISVIK